MTTAQKRQPRGVPVGGQFAASLNPESTLALDDAPVKPDWITQDERKDLLLEQLADGVDQLSSSDEWQKYLDFQTRFHNYSFNNTMLIMLQKPDASRVASFKAWKGMERSVVKGEKALYVLAPMMGKRKPKPGEDPEAAKDQKALYGFKGVPVFDVSQTDGEPLPEGAHKLAGEDAGGHFDQLTDVAKGLGFNVIDHEFSGGVNGDCNHTDRLIRVHSGNSPAQRVKTIAHEIAHAIMHDDPETRGDRGQIELEAESTAYVVCQSLGLDTGNYSFGYVAGWAGGGDDVRKKIRTSGDRIHKAAVSILDAIEAGTKEGVAA